MVTTVTHHTGLVVLLILLLVTHQSGLVDIFHFCLEKKKKPCGAISSGISLFSINDLFSTLVELCECGNLSWSMAGCYHSARVVLPWSGSIQFLTNIIQT